MKRQGAGMSIRIFGVLWVSGSCGNTHRIFLWVWDGYGDRNTVPSAALVSRPTSYLSQCSHWGQ